MSTDNKQFGFKRILIAMIVAALAMATGIWAARAVLEHKSVQDELAATRFPTAREIAPFSLVDHNNAVFDNSVLRDRWSFVFFGYTNCPDVCPTTLSVLNSVAQKLGDLDEDIRFVFLSVDPERDTPEVIGQYVANFGADTIGVTGELSELRKLTDGLGIFFEKSGADEENYSVAHSAVVLLIDPDGRFHSLFGFPHIAENFVHDLPIIVTAK